MTVVILTQFLTAGGIIELNIVDSGDDRTKLRQGIFPIMEDSFQTMQFSVWEAVIKFSPEIVFTAVIELLTGTAEFIGGCHSCTNSWRYGRSKCCGDGEGLDRVEVLTWWGSGGSGGFDTVEVKVEVWRRWVMGMMTMN